MDLMLFQSETDICSAVSHIRVNFPGADASQRGDLFVPCAGCLGRRGSVVRCWHSWWGAMGVQGLQETLYFHFGSCCIWLCVPHLHTWLKRNAALEYLNLWEMKPQLSEKVSGTESLQSSLYFAIFSRERSSRGRREITGSASRLHFCYE